jgi:hypothetical protein
MGIIGGAAIIVGLVLAAIAVVAVGGGLLVLLAYGVGLVINLVLHFDPFQVTLLSLAGLVAFGWVVARVLTSRWSWPASPSEDDYYDEDDENEEEDDEPDYHPRTPRWRPSLKYTDFSNVQPDDRCPCGSGRKYKNCHGAKRRR